jgi:hypothetical protein
VNPHAGVVFGEKAEYRRLNCGGFRLTAARTTVGGHDRADHNMNRRTVAILKPQQAGRCDKPQPGD